MKITKVKNVKTPIRGTEQSAGIDFFIPDDFPGEHYLLPNESINIASGIHVKVPEGYALIAMNKSGVAVKKNLQVGACVIDEDYQGEVHLHVTNIGQEIQTLSPGEKLVQFLLLPVSYQKVEEIANLDELYNGIETFRGGGGFGSTGNGLSRPSKKLTIV